VKLVDRNSDSKQRQQQSNDRSRLRALANTGGKVLQGGGKVLQVVFRRPGRNHHQQQHNQHGVDPADDGKEKEEPKPCPQETLAALHNACSNNSALSVIQYLVARHPDGAAATKDGNLPLHTACSRNASTSVIEHLLEEFPEGTGVRNKRYKLPIHVALECGASLDVLKLLVKKDPDSLQVADYDIESLQFQKVWIVHMGKVTMDNRAGLPLHYACKFLASLQTIHFLITEYPGESTKQNFDSKADDGYGFSMGGLFGCIYLIALVCSFCLSLILQTQPEPKTRMDGCQCITLVREEHSFRLSNT
jgi:Ankyrin repeats (3 copies)